MSAPGAVPGAVLGISPAWTTAGSLRAGLIRGASLEGSDTVRFDSGEPPPSELRIPAGWRGAYPPGYKLVGQQYRPSVTRLRAAGCHGYRIDGTSFNRVIVFRASITKP